MGEYADMEIERQLAEMDAIQDGLFENTEHDGGEDRFDDFCLRKFRSTVPAVREQRLITGINIYLKGGKIETYDPINRGDVKLWDGKVFVEHNGYSYDHDLSDVEKFEFYEELK